jgi:hypothetical protein
MTRSKQPAPRIAYDHTAAVYEAYSASGEYLGAFDTVAAARARLRCESCGRSFADGIATAKPSADMPDVCTDCREGIDA